MVKAKKLKEKSVSKPVETKEEKPADPKPEVEEKKISYVTAKIETPKDDLIMPCLYECICNITKGGQAFAPGSIIKLTQEQADRILKANPAAIKPAK